MRFNRFEIIAGTGIVVAALGTAACTSNHEDPRGVRPSASADHNSTSESSALTSLVEYRKTTGHVAVPSNGWGSPVANYLHSGDCNLVVIVNDSNGTPNSGQEAAVLNYVATNSAPTNECANPQVVAGIGNFSLVQTGDHVSSNRARDPRALARG